jgi:hypothetical protein
MTLRGPASARDAGLLPLLGPAPNSSATEQRTANRERNYDRGPHGIREDVDVFAGFGLSRMGIKKQTHMSLPLA